GGKTGLKLWRITSTSCGLIIFWVFSGFGVCLLPLFREFWVIFIPLYLLLKKNSGPEISRLMRFGTVSRISIWRFLKRSLVKVLDTFSQNLLLRRAEATTFLRPNIIPSGKLRSILMCIP